VIKDGVIIKTYQSGDFFGETALVTGAPRSADVRARTEVHLLAIDKYDFLSFVRGTDLVDALLRLARNRDLPSWDLMAANAVLGELPAKQRTHIQAHLELRRVVEGEVLWHAGGAADAGWLLDDAEVTVDGVRLGRAALLVDSEAAIRGRPL